jgi:hypothetical protein
LKQVIRFGEPVRVFGAWCTAQRERAGTKLANIPSGAMPIA